MRLRLAALALALASWPAAAVGQVTLYEDDNFRGPSRQIPSDNRYLGDFNDRASSLRVEAGCEATFYSDERFRGEELTVYGPDEVRSLRYTPVGNDAISSVRVRCDEDRRPDRPGGGPRGVTLYRDGNFGGGSETFTTDIPDLRRTGFGSDRASSVRINRRCRATLYQHENFRGKSTEVTRDISDLHGSSVGNDSASSLRVDCGREGSESGRGAVTLYRSRGFRGPLGEARSDDPDFGGQPVGSVRVPRGCNVTLYEGRYFRGRSETLTSDDDDVDLSSVGSYRVRCTSN
jgi:hypothetical protein